MTTDPELTFADFMSARWSSLFRTADLLTGDRHEAEDLLQTALARTFVRWKGIRDKGAADAYLRRAMLNLASRRWRTRGRELTLERLPEPAHDGVWGPATRGCSCGGRSSSCPRGCAPRSSCGSSRT